MSLVLVHICESKINVFYFMLKPNFIHIPQKGTQQKKKKVHDME